MYQKSVVIMGLLAVAALGSCCKKRSYCKYTSLNIAFTGFNRSESRSVWLKRFPKEKIYGRALDSCQFVYNGAKAVITGKPDTLWLSDYTTTGDLDGIYPGNDWLLLMPAVNKVYTFRQISDEGHQYEIVRCGKDDGCINKVSGYSDWDHSFRGSTVYLTR